MLHRYIAEDTPEDIDLETEEYSYNLVQMSPDKAEIIAVMSGGRWYQFFLMVSITRLSKEEKLLTLDKGCVNCAGLSADVLMAIATFCATSLRNAAPPRVRKCQWWGLRIVTRISSNEHFYLINELEL